MIIEVTDTEILEAMTEWLNEHRFKEPVRATNINLSRWMSFSDSAVSGAKPIRVNIIYFEYPRKELANE